jgi:hypothetical protein
LVRIVLIQTRWHEDDLAGRIVSEMETGGDQWDVLSLPALAEENDLLGRKAGEPLWPEWESREELERKRRAVGPREWSALYQQRSAPEQGDYFKAVWLKPYDTPPAKDTLRIYDGSDYAVTADGGDYTVHLVIGLDPEGKMYLLDHWRKQSSSDAWIEAFYDLVNNGSRWAGPSRSMPVLVRPLDRRCRERQAYFYREQAPQPPAPPKIDTGYKTYRMAERPGDWAAY